MTYLIPLFSLLAFSLSLSGQVTSLQERISQFQKEQRNALDARTMMVIEDNISNLRANGIINRALNEGDRAPNFRLPNAVGQYVSLDGLLVKGPVVLIFYRGGWCPYCYMQLSTYLDYLQEFQSRGATLVAVSPESPDDSLTTVEKHNLDYQLLSDNDNSVARDFNIVYELDDDLLDIYENFEIPLVNKVGERNTYELPLAAAYVIDTDRSIEYAFVTADYRKRAEPEEVVKALESLSGNQS